MAVFGIFCDLDILADLFIVESSVGAKVAINTVSLPYKLIDSNACLNHTKKLELFQPLPYAARQFIYQPT